MSKAALLKDLEAAVARLTEVLVSKATNDLIDSISAKLAGLIANVRKRIHSENVESKA